VDYKISHLRMLHVVYLTNCYWNCYFCVFTCHKTKHANSL